MKANQGAIVLIDQPADHGRLRSVLHGWGWQTYPHEIIRTTVLPQAT
jgi:hypothetical protein